MNGSLDRLIQSLAYQNTITEWKDVVRGLEAQVEMQKQLQVSTGTDMRRAIALIQAQIGIYKTSIAAAEERRKEIDEVDYE
jgi:hypothetical protein